MRYEGMSFDEASKLIKSKRPLSNLQSRHQQVLDAWMEQYQYEETGRYQVASQQLGTLPTLLRYPDT